MASESSWSHPPRSLSLSRDEVHVWRAQLNLDTVDMEHARATLSSDERARASRFHFPKDREHFIAARATLRIILARYLNRDPAQLEFCYSPFGKPDLAPSANPDGIRFNLSHSQGLALYAITRDHDIGVDVEAMRPNFDWEDIANRYFAPKEVEALRLVPVSLRAEASLNCWTRKEAYVKARGEGLSLSLDQFEVSVAPGEPARLLHTTADPQEPSQWSFQHLEPGPNFVAAVAVRAPRCEFKLWK